MRKNFPIMEQTASSMQHIVTAVERVTQTIADIADSSHEQSEGLGETVNHLSSEATGLDHAIAILSTDKHTSHTLR